MRRKILGLLLLLLVVAAGVVFVESRLRPGAAGSADESPYYRVVLGGGEPARAAAGDASPATQDSAGARPQSPGSGAPVLPQETAGVRDEPAAEVVAPPPEQFRYVVRRGDTLGEIVRDHLGSAATRLVERVARDNRLPDADAISLGMELLIHVDHCECHVASGRESAKDLANLYYGAPDRTAPLRRANQGLPPDDRTALPAGRVIWIPR